jgi:hypothetical protein
VGAPEIDLDANREPTLGADRGPMIAVGRELSLAVSRELSLDSGRELSLDSNREPMLAVDREAALAADRAAWLAARTFEDLCRLGAAFVEGRNTYFPGWGWPVLDEESDEIAAPLAALQRAGFLTLASQPGRAPRAGHDGAPEAQRAFVCGCACDAAARALERGAAEPGLAIAIFRRGETGGARIPVSRRGGIAHAFAGYSAFEEELECFEGSLSPAAMRALEGSSYVSAIDLVWGRSSTLWSELLRRLASR